jgi:beta-lactamase class A
MQDTSSPQDIDHKMPQVAQRFSGEVALAARNLATGEEMRFNADKVYGTASTIKLAVLIEVFHRARAGTLHLQERVEMHESDIVRGSGVLKELSPGLQPTIGDLATLMVIVSDNTATNMLIDRVGGVDVINQTVDALSKAISAAYREGMVNGIPTWQGWIGIPLPRTSR